MDQQTTIENTKSTALAKANGTTAMTKVTTKDLDKSVAKIKAIMGRAGEACWEMGQEILVIFESGSWKARVGEDGEQLYKNWGAFTKAELGIGGSYALGCMDASKLYGKEQLNEWGVSKVQMLVQAPPEARAKLEKEVAKHSKRSLGEAVKKAKAESGAGKRETGRKKMPKGKNAAERAPKPGKVAERITVASIIGSKTVKLWKRGQADVDGQRAETLAHEPVGYLDLENGVRMFFSVEKTDAGLVLKTTTKRVDPDGKPIKS